MSLLSPHRETSLLRDVALICAAFLPALLLPGEGPYAASGLPGQIPKSPPYVAGFPIAFPAAADYRPREGSVTVADLDGDGKPELVVSLPTGVLSVLRADGSPAPGWPRSFADLPQPAYPLGAPGIGDLDGDGSPEVVTCVVSGSAMRRNFLYAFRADGSILRGWPVEVSSTAGGYYSCSPGGVLLADLDGDGRPEVVRGMNLDEVQALGGDGRALPGWPVRLGPDALGHVRGINADLAAADLDGDGRQEVLFVESGFQPRFVAVSGNGRFMPGFPLILPEVVDRQAPAAADLDGDGIPELVQSTLPFDGTSVGGAPEPGPSGPPVPAALHVMRADGSSLPGWPRGLTAGGPWGSVLADLLAGARPIILQQDGDLLAGYDASGALLAGFPLTARRDFLRADSTFESYWVVADLDADARPDLVQAKSVLFAGVPYLRLFGLHTTGQRVQGFPFDAAGFLAASKPVVVDLNADGVGDLVVLVTDGASGGYHLVAWDLSALLRGNQS